MNIHETGLSCWLCGDFRCIYICDVEFTVSSLCDIQGPVVEFHDQFTS